MLKRYGKRDKINADFHGSEPESLFPEWRNELPQVYKQRRLFLSVIFRHSPQLWNTIFTLNALNIGTTVRFTIAEFNIVKDGGVALCHLKYCQLIHVEPLPESSLSQYAVR